MIGVFAAGSVMMGSSLGVMALGHHNSQESVHSFSLWSSYYYSVLMFIVHACNAGMKGMLRE